MTNPSECLLDFWQKLKKKKKDITGISKEVGPRPVEES